jgi:hypothetical protein
MIAAFLYGLWILQDVNAFGEQMSYQLARKDRPLFLTIVNTVKHYRHDPLALAMPVVSLAFLFPQAMRQRGNVWLLVLCLGALMVTAISQFETPYHVYIAPLGAGATAMLLVALWNSSSRMKRSTAIICIGALLLNSVSVFSYLNFVVHTRVTGKASYDQLCKSISDHVPAGARLCGWGTPCVYWGLNEHRPDIAFTDPEFLDSIRANEVARGIDYVVLSRAFVPTEDETALTRQRNRLSELCARNGRALKAVTMVGQKEEYSYSAEVFQVISLAGQ